jgi:coatomer subunit beta'
LELLLATDRIAEAAFFARTYLPSQVPRVVQLWRDNLQKSGQVKSSESIADPLAFENLFPSYKYVRAISFFS